MQKPAPDPTRAVAYLRCSTDRQDLSPGRPARARSGLGSARSIGVVAWHEDLGVSGGAELEDRPGLTAAVGRPRRARRRGPGRGQAGPPRPRRADRRAGRAAGRAGGGADPVGGRHGGTGTGPRRRCSARIVDGFAAYERALIRARTKAALAVKKARGERVGGVPYGYRVAADAVRSRRSPASRRSIARARELRAEGLSLRARRAGAARGGPRAADRDAVACAGAGADGRPVAGVAPVLRRPRLPDNGSLVGKLQRERATLAFHAVRALDLETPHP